ncbi:hypothetical protein [Diaphorobacter caeni]|uniref:hypothetical protein n=1 Tax=Diaphorobacter caeni TaxID=2784387 RepID=UPI00188E36A4|nr:hypothetical protein [Diaphorobacter caeni]MBF5004108.1 hypothetical protein [Diaphorobacter caeni]
MTKRTLAAHRILTIAVGGTLATTLATALALGGAAAAHAAEALNAAQQGQFDEMERIVFQGQAVPRDIRALCTHQIRRGKRPVLGYDVYEDLSAYCLTPKMASEPRSTSYLSAAELKDPSIAATVKATHEVMSFITFAVKTDDGDFIGYWQWPKGTPIEQARIVRYDTEGQFNLMEGRTITEALLHEMADPTTDEFSDTPSAKRYARAKKALEKLGAGTLPASFEALDKQSLPTPQKRPDRLQDELYKRYLATTQPASRK